jgi:hypothetical protein
MFADRLLDHQPDHHSHRGGTILASLALEALGVGIVLLLPLLHPDGLLQLQLKGTMTRPAPPPAPSPGPRRPPTSDHRNLIGNPILEIGEISRAVPNTIETEPPPAG